MIRDRVEASVNASNGATGQNGRLLVGPEKVISRAAPDAPQTSAGDSLQKFSGIGPAEADLSP